MTEAATAAAPAASDLLSNNAAPATPPAPSFMPAGFPVTPAAFNAPEAVTAREQIEARKNDKEFGKRLLAKDPAATAEWAGLHKAGYPAPVQIASAEDVNSQAAARNAEEWNNYFGWLKQRFALTPENEAELRGGIIRADLHAWAKEEKNRLVLDRGFYRKLLDGDVKANDQWQRVTLMLSLRPVKPQ